MTKPQEELPINKGLKYRSGELELILSLAPTEDNIKRLALTLGRSKEAIEIVYRIAFQPNQPFAKDAGSQRKKVETAKSKLGIKIFPTSR